MGLLKPNQVLNKAYRQVAIETTDFDLFKNALRTLRDNIVDGQREHTQKEHLRNFLSETFYKPYYMAPEEDIDLAIDREFLGFTEITKRKTNLRKKSGKFVSGDFVCTFVTNYVPRIIMKWYVLIKCSTNISI